MKTNKILLTTAIIASLGSASMATTINSDGVQALGDSNKIKYLTNTNIVGSSNEVSGKDNVVIGNSNKVAGHSAIAIGNNIYSKAQTSDDFTSLWPEGKGAITIGDHTKVTQEANTAIGYLAQSYGNASVAVGAYSMAFDDVHKVDSKYAGVATNQGVFSIGSSYPTIYDKGTTPPNKFKVFTRQLQNVGAGAISATSTDAVNGSQLYDVMMEAQKHTVVQSGDDNIVVEGEDGLYTVSTNKNLKAETLSLNDGNNESRYSTEGISMVYRGNGSEPEYKTTYNYNGIRIATNDGNASPIDEVTLTDKGLNNGGHKITNIDRGANDTDAVNVSQLKETNSKVDGNKKAIDNHEGRITANENNVKDLENKITDVGQNVLNRANTYTDMQVNKGVAKASALAGLKFLDYNPKDKWSFAASVGHYRNANAVAIGAAYQPNDNTMIHGGITLDGKAAYNLGVSFKTGGEKYVNKYVLQDQVKQLQSDNAELRQELKELRAMIEKNK